MYLVSADAASA